MTRAISLTQPWATLVVTGRKAMETRSWPTSVRGRVAIHASKGMPGWAREAAVQFGFDPDALPRGAIIGAVDIEDCQPVEEVREAISDDELSYGDFDNGRFAWRLSNPAIFDEPIPAVGSLGFWRWEPRR